MSSHITQADCGFGMNNIHFYNTLSAIVNTVARK